MHRKNYQEIAKILKHHYGITTPRVRETLARLMVDLADYFQEENRLFNRDLFLAASGHPDHNESDLKLLS